MADSHYNPHPLQDPNSGKEIPPAFGAVPAKDPMTQNIGPGDDDYGRKAAWHTVSGILTAPLTDHYNAGRCPTCGEFAVQAERSMDGRVACRHNHWWVRPGSASNPNKEGPTIAVDPAKPGTDHTCCKAKFTIEVQIQQHRTDGTASMVVWTGDHDQLLQVRLDKMPDEVTIKRLVEGVMSAAFSGIKDLDRRINHPDASTIIDMLNRNY